MCSESLAICLPSLFALLAASLSFSPSPPQNCHTASSLTSISASSPFQSIGSISFIRNILANSSHEVTEQLFLVFQPFFFDNGLTAFANLPTALKHLVASQMNVFLYFLQTVRLSRQERRIRIRKRFLCPRKEGRV